MLIDPKIRLTWLSFLSFEGLGKCPEKAIDSSNLGSNLGSNVPFGTDDDFVSIPRALVFEN